MKKQLFLVLLSVFLVPSCGSNNQDNTSSHTHLYSSTWSYDSEGHWHASTCGHDVIKDYAPHTFGEWVITTEPTATTAGSKYKPCTVCPYRLTEVIPATGEDPGPTHEHTYSDEWSYDDTYHWHASTCGHNVIKDKGVHQFGNWITDIEPTETKDGHKYRTCSICPKVEEATIPATGGTEEEKETQSEIDSIQDMNILHAWDWKLNDIKSRLKRIKSAGYGAIQISPMQPHVDNANGAKGITQDNWWKLYQPLGFKVATGEENILGTKNDLTSLCVEANKQGLKIIVDVVTNHLAGTNNNYSNQVY